MYMRSVHVLIFGTPVDQMSMVLLLMFLSPPLRGAGPMALMLGHEWQHIYKKNRHAGYIKCA
jgi:hypothetical protein